MKASEQTFSKIIQSDHGNEHYHVPKYQRAYSWTQKNWTQLFDDIDENEAGHFIGSIICIEDNSQQKPGHDRIYEVIDGQQRLTTISLLLAALYQKIGECISDMESENDYDEDDLDELKAKYRGIRLQLIKPLKTDVKDQRGSIKMGKKHILLRVQPSSQKNNLDDYLHTLRGVLNEQSKGPSYYGNRMVAKAYRYFEERLPDDTEALVLLADKINQLQLVHISVDSHTNAFRLFETLNNRGVPLTAVDIVKNKMLSEMERQHAVSIDDAYEQWQGMLKDIEDVEDRFLRQFYNAFKHKKEIGQPSFATKATASTLIPIYEKIIQSNAQRLFDDLINKAGIYGEIIQPDEDTELGRALADLNRIGAVPCYTLLMYLMALDDKHFSEFEDTLLRIVEFLQKYFVRRNITDTPGTRDLDQLQIDVIDACEACVSKKQTIEASLIMDAYCEGRGEPASLKEFADHLVDNLFDYNKPMARYILIKLDEQSHSREYKPDLWARNDKGQYVWTVEHVFPQGDNIPAHWVEMIADGDADLATEIQEEWVHCLGNLTLSGYNSRLSNQDFERKQSKTNMTAAGQKIEIGYKNGLYLNNLEFPYGRKKQSLASIKKWTRQSIEKRNVAMVDMLTEIYRFDGED